MQIKKSGVGLRLFGAKHLLERREKCVLLVIKMVAKVFGRRWTAKVPVGANTTTANPNPITAPYSVRPGRHLIQLNATPLFFELPAGDSQKLQKTR